MDQTVTSQQRSLGGQGAVWRPCHGFRLVPITTSRHGAEESSIVGSQRANIQATNTVRFRHDRLEHRRQIAARRVDHLQNLGGRGLLLQRLALFGDQPRVLHRDHGLIGKCLQQRDLALREKSCHWAAVEMHPEEADRLHNGTMPVQTRAQEDAPCHIPDQRQYRRSARRAGLGSPGPWRYLAPPAAETAPHRLSHTRHRSRSVRRDASMMPSNGRRRPLEHRTASPRSADQHRTPAGIAGGTVDDVQDLGQRSLPRQRRVAFLSQFRDDVLSILCRVVLRRGHVFPLPVRAIVDRCRAIRRVAVVGRFSNLSRAVDERLGAGPARAEAGEGTASRRRHN